MKRTTATPTAERTIMGSSMGKAFARSGSHSFPNPLFVQGAGLVASPLPICGGRMSDVPRHLMTHPDGPPDGAAHHAYLMEATRVQRVACMYCRTLIRVQPCSPAMAGTTSHGICDACWPRACREMGQSETTARQK